MINIDEDNLEYPVVIEIPENYWVCSHDVGYINED